MALKKYTLMLDLEDVERLKKEAEERGTKYQTIVRELVKAHLKKKSR